MKRIGNTLSDGAAMAPDNTNKNSLSVCMIVKNEAALLPRCLESIRPLADEIILVDTGSTDDTRDIAENFGCRIFDYPWTGDFAAARNESMKHAEKDWIFVIDADEELPGDAVGHVRKIMEKDGVEIASLTVVNKSLESGRISSVLPSIRLFRRHLGLRYDGTVHNRLAIPPGTTVVRTDMELYHYGYDLPDDKLRDKQARSRELLEKQLRDNPDDTFANFNMAQLLMGRHGTADEETCRTILSHATRVIENYDSSQTGHLGYFLMAHFQAATALCALRRYDEAERLCHAALERKDDYLDIIITLANIRLAVADLKGAREYYSQYLKSADNYRPDRERHDIIMHHLRSHHIAEYGLATVCRLENNVDDALKHYRRVAREYGPYLDTYYVMGMLYLHRNEPARAEEILSEAIKHNPDSASAHMALARALDMQGRGDRGIEHLQKAHIAAPDNAEISLALAAMLINMGRLDEGIRQIKAAAKSAGDNHRLRFKAAGMFFEVGDFVPASDNYRVCLEQNPLWPEAYANLGNCYFRQEMYDHAAACYETALTLAPDYDLARRNLGLTRARTGHAADSLAILDEYMERHGDDIEICRLVGDLSLSSGRYGHAITCYEKCLKADPADVNSLFHISEAYRAMGHIQAAEAGYRHILDVNPGFEPARERLNEPAPTTTR